MSRQEGGAGAARSARRWGWWLLAAVIAAWLLWMTLRSQVSVCDDLAPLVATAQARGISPRFLIGLLGNIAVFVPLGATVFLALKDATPRWAVFWSTAAGAGLSALIEGLQRYSAGRVSDWRDWGLNTLGALAGALVMVAVRRVRRA